MRRIERNSPAFVRECSATITFSSAVIVPNRRMFWNVRAIPRSTIRSGRIAVMFAPSNTIAPVLGR